MPGTPGPLEVVPSPTAHFLGSDGFLALSESSTEILLLSTDFWLKIVPKIIKYCIPRVPPFFWALRSPHPVLRVGEKARYVVRRETARRLHGDLPSARSTPPEEPGRERRARDKEEEQASWAGHLISVSFMRDFLFS